MEIIFVYMILIYLIYGNGFGLGFLWCDEMILYLNC